jgi:hypothetical protein
MALSMTERCVLLAAAASPLEWYSGEWYRVDLPAGRQRVRVGALLQRELLRRSGPATLALTDDGLEVAETFRDALDPERRQILRVLDSAGELVRRERRISELEAVAVWAEGAEPSETVVEWLRPVVDGPWTHGREPARICSGTDLDYLRELGLVVLLAGGTRAQLTGAGRWCAAEGPSSDSKPGVDQGAPGGGPEPETASEGCCGPGNGVSR